MIFRAERPPAGENTVSIAEYDGGVDIFVNDFRIAHLAPNGVLQLETMEDCGIPLKTGKIGYIVVERRIS